MADKNWELVYRTSEAEHRVLRRTGLRQHHRATRILHRIDDMPVVISAYLEPIVARGVCLWHNHSPYTEMDNHSIVCAVCGKLLGHQERRIKTPPVEPTDGPADPGKGPAAGPEQPGPEGLRVID